MSNKPTGPGQEATPRLMQDLPANFIETQTPEISVEELLVRVQEEVGRRRKLASSLSNSSDPLPVSYLGTGRRSRSSLDWGLLTAKLRIAEKNAAVGQKVPKLLRYPGPLRMVARLLAAVILYPLKMITNPQREFNVATLVALQALKDGVRQMEKVHQHSLAKMEEYQERRLDLILDEERSEQLQAMFANSPLTRQDEIQSHSSIPFRHGLRRRRHEFHVIYPRSIARPGISVQHLRRAYPAGNCLPSLQL